MRTRHRIRSQIAVLTMILIAQASCHPQAPGDGVASVDDADADTYADTIFVNGRIYTVDGSRSWAEAVAVRDGRINYVGTDAAARALAGPATQVVDLGGRMMLPGMHDSHVHLLTTGVEQLGCDLSAGHSVDEYLAIVKACADERPDDAWVYGSGWSMDAVGPGGKASRKLLDDIVPDRAVYLETSDGHTAWVNSKALQIAGITADTPDPEKGLIDREPGSREPLGTLQETATDLVERLYPVTVDMVARGLQNGIHMLNGYGITSVQEAKAGDFDLARDMDAFIVLQERGELTLRVVESMKWHPELGLAQIADFEKQRARFASGRLRATTVKIFQDGVMENFTAAMLEPYAGQGGTRGLPRQTPGELNAAVVALDAAGFQVHFHAVGDAAIRQCLDAVEAARDTNGASDHRHHIAHLELIDPDDIPRFRELNVVANFQPLWAYADEYITELTLPFIGAARGRWLYPIGSVYRSGGIIAFGSDWSVSTANPFPQIETAITRRNPGDASDSVFIAEEVISLPEAIAAFTINGAWVNHSERDTGSIEVGKYADLAVLDRNLFEIAPEDISETLVLLTVLEGEVVYGDIESL